MSNGLAAHPWPMYRALVGIGLLSGFIIVLVFQTTAPVISRNQAEALEKAVFNVLPAAHDKIAYRLNSDGIFESAEKAAPSDHLVYAGYDANGSLVGFAIEASGMGYQDSIDLLYGYAPAQNAIVGLEVLQSRETPGLGDRIGRNPFLRNFNQLDVALGPDHTQPLHPIEVVKAGTKSRPWQIDSITGATVSSNAVGSILKQSVATWIPLLTQRMEDFKLGHPTRH
jgi:electron transport complex protein RnfG